uniref:Uncharacterized protein n=1 Tax=Timema poppense TaxID=170557 RepID=A0A7R9H5K6_TIMPO|nr:unnamed protein product [Timema poppensis]
MVRNLRSTIPNWIMFSACSVAQYMKLVSRDPLRAEQFQVMERVHDKYPALVNRCVIAECRYDVVNRTLNEQARGTHILAVHGGWGAWDPWSLCSASCGEGARYRQRACNNPPPSLSELECTGQEFQTQPCTGTACAARKDGVWTSWSSWSKCNPSCGLGIRTRKRNCERKKKRQIYKEVTFQDGTNKLAWSGHHHTRVMRSVNSCVGPAQEVEECNNKDCTGKLQHCKVMIRSNVHPVSFPRMKDPSFILDPKQVDGSWSAWQGWSACSADCGLGAQSRSRACSNPAPHGGGNMCSGAVTEVQHCFVRPCAVKTHRIAVFSGDGALLFAESGRPSRLLHLYLRFRPLSPTGVLLHRYPVLCEREGCDFVRMALEGGYVVVSAQVTSCSAAVISHTILQTGEWHEVLATVTGSVVALRVDDSVVRSESPFNCVPSMFDLDQAMRVGERFKGHIQQLAFNFHPIRLHKQKGELSLAGFAPYGVSNVVYETADQEEGFRKLDPKEVVRAPCPTLASNWQVELAVKPEKKDGLLLYLPQSSGDYVLATLESGKVRVRVKAGAVSTEGDSPEEIVANQWLHILLNRGAAQGDIGISVNGGDRVSLSATAAKLQPDQAMMCNGEMLIGIVADSIKKDLESQTNGLKLQPLSGILGYLAVDGVSKDIGALPSESQTRGQLSSHSASYTERYEEVSLLLGHPMELTCAYSGYGRSAQWVHLDLPLKDSQRYPGEVEYSVVDNGKVSRLTATSYISRATLEGFYSCRHVKKKRFVSAQATSHLWADPRRQGRRVGRCFICGNLCDSYPHPVYNPAVYQGRDDVCYIILFPEWAGVSYVVIPVIAILTLFTTLLFIGFLIIHISSTQSHKFGLYHKLLLLWQWKTLSSEEETENMILQLHSKRAHLVIGSEFNVCKAEVMLRGSRGMPHVYTSDPELPSPPPIPKSSSVKKTSLSITQSFPVLMSDQSSFFGGPSKTIQNFPIQMSNHSSIFGAPLLHPRPLSRRAVSEPYSKNTQGSLKHVSWSKTSKPQPRNNLLGPKLVQINCQNSNETPTNMLQHDLVDQTYIKSNLSMPQQNLLRESSYNELDKRNQEVPMKSSNLSKPDISIQNSSDNSCYHTKSSQNIEHSLEQSRPLNNQNVSQISSSSSKILHSLTPVCSFSQSINGTESTKPSFTKTVAQVSSCSTRSPHTTTSGHLNTSNTVKSLVDRFSRNLSSEAKDLTGNNPIRTSEKDSFATFNSQVNLSSNNPSQSSKSVVNTMSATVSTMMRTSEQTGSLSSDEKYTLWKLLPVVTGPTESGGVIVGGTNEMVVGNVVSRKPSLAKISEHHLNIDMVAREVQDLYH